jgi:CheY-like chemotaxis protein
MTVIVTVEDEFLTSDYLGGILEDAGYEVVATSNADEAIAILEARNDIRIAESEPMRSPIPTHPAAFVEAHISFDAQEPSGANAERQND